MSFFADGGIVAGSTSVWLDIILRKKADSTELAGLVYNTSGNAAAYHRAGAAPVAITLATQTVTGAWSAGGFVENDATKGPGSYRLDVPDAAFAPGADWVTIYFVTTSGFCYQERFPLVSPGRQIQSHYFTRKYNLLTTTGTNLRVQLAKVSGQALSADWTPATGDVKVSKDSGSEANIGTLPSFVNGAWEFVLTAAELSAKTACVRVASAAPKHVDDAFIVIETFGDPLAMFKDDIGAVGFGPADSGVARAGGANTVQLASTAPSVDISGQLFVPISGTGAGQPAIILSYNTSTKTCTMSRNWPTANPDDTTGYIVMPILNAGVDANGASPATLTATERNAAADALLDRADAIETGVTVRGFMRAVGSLVVGNSTTLSTATQIFKNMVANAKTRLTFSRSGNSRTLSSSDLT